MQNAAAMQAVVDDLNAKVQQIKLGGGESLIARHTARGKLFARDRIQKLLDPGSPFLEVAQFAGWECYDDYVPAAGVVAGIGRVNGVECMVSANDPTVKAGAWFPMTGKKNLRAQEIAMENRIPILYLVDSAGVYLPMQDEIFPDEDDFGRIFRHNAVISAAGIPQYAAIMGNCVAGGAYLPVLCDQILMTEGSGLYLAGPQLVKAAIGQVSDPEERVKLRDQIADKVRSVTGMSCIVELVPPRTLPRTSSGKLSRAKAKKLYLAGEIVPISLAA